METQNYEHISALMDEEIASRKECELAVTALLDNADAQRAWYEYHLIRDCLQNHQTELGYDVSPLLKNRLQQEGKLRITKRAYIPVNQAFKGFAVAASIAAVAVAVWQIVPSGTSPDALSAMNGNPEVAAPLMLGKSTTLSNTQAQPNTQSITPDDIAVSLDNPYLQAHQRAMTTDGLMRVSASFDGAQ